MTKEDERERDVAFTIAVTAAALLPRLFVAIAWAREPVWDGHYYHFGASRIAEGLGYSEDVIVHGASVWKPWCHYPVGYSAFLGLVYRFFGDGLVVAPVVNAIVGALVVLVVHRLARRYVSVTRARIAAAIAALHPGLIANAALVMNEVLTALLVLSAFYVAVRWRGRWHGVVPAGVLIGLAALVRPSSLALAPLLAFAMPPPRVKSLGWAVAALVTSLVVVLPWTVRNCRVMDGCALVSTNGGWNLAIGALTTTGRFHALLSSDGCPAVTGQVQQDRCWAEVGRRTILADPAAWLAKAPKKLGHTFDHESFPVEYLREADPASWPEARRVAGRQLLTGFHRLLLVAAALSVFAWAGVGRVLSGAGIVQTLGALSVVGFGVHAFTDVRHPFFWLVLLMPLVALARLPGAPRHGPVGRVLVALVAATALTHVLFFGDDRYHIVVSPALCILAAAMLRRRDSAPAEVA